MHNAVIIVVFLLTYVGMAAGRLPWLSVDRTGIALLGVVALLASQQVTLDELGSSIDAPTLVLLFALMIISAQFVASGFFEICCDWLMAQSDEPAVLLGLTVAVCGALSALLVNDLVAFTMAPLLIAGAQARNLDPRPFLIALIGASNAGSAATFIGNPQNILIGQMGGLSFHGFLVACLVPALVGLGCVYSVVWLMWRDRIGATALAASQVVADLSRHPHDRNQTIKGLIALGAMLVLFATPLPREIGGMLIAAVLLSNRKFTSRTMIAAVDWPLVLLFLCLFAITGTLADTGIAFSALSGVQSIGLGPDSLLVLTPLTLLMSNIIGTVPWVMFLMQTWPSPPAGALYGLALITSLAGNLLLLGSVANVIVVERAKALGIRLSNAEYARAAVPFTLLSLTFAVLWLAWTGAMTWLPVAD
ncbi:MAG: anion transporter [Alphaproteobacteria bacterium]|nr:anion transporter [Alphaproteobacteria bacterium]